MVSINQRFLEYDTINTKAVFFSIIDIDYLIYKLKLLCDIKSHQNLQIIIFVVPSYHVKETINFQGFHKTRTKDSCSRRRT